MSTNNIANNIDSIGKLVSSMTLTGRVHDAIDRIHQWQRYMADRVDVADGPEVAAAFEAQIAALESFAAQLKPTRADILRAKLAAEEATPAA